MTKRGKECLIKYENKNRVIKQRTIYKNKRPCLKLAFYFY